MTNAANPTLHPIFQAALAPFRPLTVEEVLDLAYEAAADASFAYWHAHGDNMDCGGAWVVVPGRSPIAKWHKAHNTSGFKHHAGGFAIPVCRSLPVQSRIIIEKGADAFVKVLNAHGFDAHVYSYAD